MLPLVAMRLGRVIGTVVSSDSHPAFQARKMMLVRMLDDQRQPTGSTMVAVDYVSAGPGDTVLVGAAPGLAEVVFNMKPAPIDDLIMGIVDRVS